MQKKDVIDFFDMLAQTWDDTLVPNNPVIDRIADNAKICEGQDVLDVACGTGVMFPYYLKRGVGSVTGIDISSEMVKKAQDKLSDIDNIRVICGDVEDTSFDRQFDCVMVYNAFPHFPDPARLVKNLCALLKDGGRLTIAHGLPRAVIDDHHKGSASKVSMGLMPVDSLKKLFDPYFDVEIMISDDNMYQVTGVKRAPLDHIHCAVPYTHSHADDGSVIADYSSVTPMDELMALLKYMVGHNSSHAQEVADLAQKLLFAGHQDSYSEIMDAVADFDKVNTKLAAALDKLIKNK